MRAILGMAGCYRSEKGWAIKYKGSVPNFSLISLNFSGINQMTKAVHELDEVTQHNAADASQDLQIATDMESEALRLNGFVKQLDALVKGERGNR